MSRQPDDLEIGSVRRAHGVRGEVLVRLTTDRLERVAPGAVLRTDSDELVVQSSRPHQGGHLVSFRGVENREAAESFRNKMLYAAPIEDPNVIWVHELIGAAVEEVDGTPRGTVVAVQENPAADLMVVDSGALVPLTFLVELTDAIAVIDPPAGLFDLDGSR